MSNVLRKKAGMKNLFFKLNMKHSSSLTRASQKFLYPIEILLLSFGFFGNTANTLAMQSAEPQAPRRPELQLRTLNLESDELQSYMKANDLLLAEITFVQNQLLKKYENSRHEIPDKIAQKNNLTNIQAAREYARTRRALERQLHPVSRNPLRHFWESKRKKTYNEGNCDLKAAALSNTAHRIKELGEAAAKKAEQVESKKKETQIPSIDLNAYLNCIKKAADTVLRTPYQHWLDPKMVHHTMQHRKHTVLTFLNRNYDKGAALANEKLTNGYLTEAWGNVNSALQGMMQCSLSYDPLFHPFRDPVNPEEVDEYISSSNYLNLLEEYLPGFQTTFARKFPSKQHPLPITRPDAVVEMERPVSLHIPSSSTASASREVESGGSQ